MPTVEISPQAYAIIVRQAQERAQSPDEAASQLITAATEHPYVEHRPEVLGGKPTIKGSRLPVWQLAERLKLGDSPDELLDAYPHLSAAAVYDALSYYYDHRAEIEHQIEENRFENSLTRQRARLDEQGRITFQDLSPRD